MTALVGVLCKNGVVLGADSSATLGQGTLHTVEQPVEKIKIIDESVILAGTGQVGLNQRFCSIVTAAWADKKFTGNYWNVAKQLCADACTDFGQTGAPKGQYGALVAFPVHKRHYLFEFEMENFQPELKDENLWYASMGITQTMTDSFLALMREVYWGEGPPDIQDGVFAVTWTLEHAVKYNVGGVNKPIHIAVLETQNGKSVARLLDDSELDEHRQHIEDVKEKLREFRREHQGIKPSDTPDVPRL